MVRNIYSNLIKKCLCVPIDILFVISVVFFICSYLLDKNINYISLIFACSTLLFRIVFVNVLIAIINKFGKNKVEFNKDFILFKGTKRYIGDLSFKYFKFHIDIVNLSLVFPKLKINAEQISILCYISKREVKKLIKMGYEISSI